MIAAAQEAPTPTKPEALSKIASEAVRQAANDLISVSDTHTIQCNPGLMSHIAGAGTCISLPAAIAYVRRRDLFVNGTYQQTRVMAFQHLRCGLFHRFYNEFHGTAEGIPTPFWSRLNDLREAHKLDTFKQQGKYVPIFLYPDVSDYAKLLKQYADIFQELEKHIGQ